MIVINNETELNELISNNEIVLVYFNGTTCGACEIIKKRLKEIISRFPKIQSYEVNGDKNPYLAMKYDIFSLPIMLLFIDGKETLRIGRNVDFQDLEKQIDRYYTMIFN